MVKMGQQVQPLANSLGRRDPGPGLRAVVGPSEAVRRGRRFAFFVLFFALALVFFAVPFFPTGRERAERRGAPPASRSMPKTEERSSSEASERWRGERRRPGAPAAAAAATSSTGSTPRRVKSSSGSRSIRQPTP
jgi:hypothetical protein